MPPIIAPLPTSGWPARVITSARAGCSAKPTARTAGRTYRPDCRGIHRYGLSCSSPTTRQWYMPAPRTAFSEAPTAAAAGSAWADPAGDREVWSLAGHPSDPDTIFVGYEPCTIARSKDGGDTWQEMDTSGVIFPHITTYMPPLGKRVIGIAVDPVDPNNMYAAIEVGGLLASRDGGETWQQLMDGPYLRNNTLDLHAAQVSAADHETVQIATQIAMFRGRQQGTRWEHVQVDDMFVGGSYCRDLAVAPDDPNTIYLASGAGGGAAPPDTVPEGALFRSRDVGETWERLDLGDVPPGRMMQVAIDPAAPSRISCASYSGEVYSSSDGGQTWMKSMLPVESTRSLHIYPMVCG